jgi:GNAT superfamily N-acetyltransferase
LTRRREAFALASSSGSPGAFQKWAPHVLEIREGDFEAFFEAPWACYGRSTPFVSALKGDLRRALDATKNPLYRQFARRTYFTAHRDGGKSAVGRILVQIHDASNALHGWKRASFGLFDLVDDKNVAEALLHAASTWARDRGCNELIGSFNLTITQVIGVVTEGFEGAPYTYQEWTPPHVARLLDQLGYVRVFPMRTFEIDVLQVEHDELLSESAVALTRDPDWTFEPIRRHGFKDRLRECATVLNNAFARNAMFVPLTEEEFLFPCEGMMWVIDERLSWIARHRGRAVAALLCTPDLNPFLRATGFRLKWSTPWHLLRSRFRRKRAALIFFAVCREHQGQGVNQVMLHRLISEMQGAGYETLGISWVSDTNEASLRQMERLHGRALHRLHLFRKEI